MVTNYIIDYIMLVQKRIHIYFPIKSQILNIFSSEYIFYLRNILKETGF